MMALWASAFAGDLVLQNAHVVEADGARHVEAVVVRDGLIVSVGDLPETLHDPQRVDLKGASLVPGLMDCHVHLAFTPSGAHLDLSPAEERDLWAHHLRAYVASGVTTVLDTGIPLESAKTMNQLATEGAAPDIHYLGPIISPEGGYPAVAVSALESVTSADDVRRQIDAFEPLGPLGIKVTVERGLITPIWPLYTDEIRAALMEESAKRSLPLYAHAMGSGEVKKALALGPAGLVHPPAKAKRGLVKTIVAAEIPVVTTLSVYDSLLIGVEPERLEHPLVVLTVPEVEREAARDPQVLASFSDAMVKTVMPRAPGFVRGMAKGMLGKKKVLQRRLDKQGRSVMALHRAGVPLVVGSDSGNWPILPFEFHGSTTLAEMVALQEAGLPPEAILRAGTVAAAEMLGIADQVGRIQPGFRADLLVVDGDPLSDIGALRNGLWVVRAGEIRTPMEWMASPSRDP